MMTVKELITELKKHNLKAEMRPMHILASELKDELRECNLPEDRPFAIEADGNVVYLLLEYS